MDAAGLTVLLKELQADCVVAADAGSKAAIRVRQDSPGHLEACAYELARFYNVLENMLERICDGFENHLEKRGDYHERLIQRLTYATRRRATALPNWMGGVGRAMRKSGICWKGRIVANLS